MLSPAAALKETMHKSWLTVQIPPVAPSALATLVACIVVLLVLPVFFTFRKKTGIRELGGFSLLSAWSFFNRRSDFLKENFKKTGENMYSFNTLHHKLTAVKGHEARVAFFDSKNLNSLEGYKLLMGAAPRLAEIGEISQPEELPWFNKHLAILMNKQRLSDALPTLFDDIQARMEGWGKEGRIDPFRDVYDLVFQMTVRMATCQELSNNLEAMTQFQKYYWILEKSSTPVSLLFPWFPSKAKKDKEAATRNLFTTLYGYVEKRRAADVPSTDAIDILISKGLKNEEIIGFVLNVVFAGVINTGINVCWTLLFLSINSEWKKKVISEVHALIDNHTNTLSHEPLHKRLSAIPISTWEDEMPVLDVVIRETIRITSGGAALRRNVVSDLKISDKTIPMGNFMAYQLSDAHLNPEIYSDPLVFDPTRFGPERQEDKKYTFAYLGWGAGRHPCAGMKIAKLEIKVIVALFLAGYEYSIVDSAGNLTKRLPLPNYNDIQQARPIGDPCFIRYKRVVE